MKVMQFQVFFQSVYIAPSTSTDTALVHSLNQYHHLFYLLISYLLLKITKKVKTDPNFSKFNEKWNFWKEEPCKIVWIFFYVEAEFLLQKIIHKHRLWPLWNKFWIFGKTKKFSIFFYFIFANSCVSQNDMTQIWLDQKLHIVAQEDNLENVQSQRNN